MSPHETVRINATTDSAPSANDHSKRLKHPMAIAICGMACRLPGNLTTPQKLWDFVVSKGDARSRVPASRYNIDGFHDADRTGFPGGIKTSHSYFLDESADLAGFDTSFFSLPRAELERLDPTHRQMLEVAREALDDAGEVGWRGGNVGCYMGSFGEEWEDLFAQDNQQHGIYRLTGYGDFMLSNRLSYEMDLKGPSMVIRTGCSASLVALHEACRALQNGDCTSALVGGANLILGPGLTQALTEQGVLSPEGSCKSFSADADGYARAEAINAIYIKPLSDAIRDGNPVRAVIRGTATNCDGKTPGVTVPNTDAHETMIRRAYTSTGLDPSQTGYVECHGTGTTTGDPLEASAIARIFGEAGVHIGSVKPNVGHSEGASGLTSLIKTVLALENRIIPPSIKSNPPNPKIPFKEWNLTVPLEPTPWPADRLERASINSFGIGGTNAHIILDSGASALGTKAQTPAVEYSDAPRLLVYSAASVDSLNKTIAAYQELVEKDPDFNLTSLAFTLATRREHLSYRSFAVATNGNVGPAAPATRAPATAPSIVMVFTGQGAQWALMGRELLQSNAAFAATIRALDKHLHEDSPNGPAWTIEAELLKPARTSNIQKAELSQPLCTAIQVGLVDALRAVGVTADAVVGHSSGELGAAYAAGALTAAEAITAAWRRGLVTQQQTKAGAMAAVGMGWAEVEPFLIPGVVGVACENSPDSVTLSGDAEQVRTVCAAIQKERPDMLVRLLKVDKAYHSHHMVDIGDAYHALIEHDIEPRQPKIALFSSVHGRLLGAQETLGARYWQRNLESTVRFREAVTAILQMPEISQNATFVEIGPHSALAGPLRQIVQANGAHEHGIPYIPAMLRGEDCTATLLTALGKLHTRGVTLNWARLFPETAKTLPDLPRYAWDHQDGASFWYESRLTAEWRNRKFKHHSLLGIRLPESSDFEPCWRNVFHLDSASWVRDHKVGEDIVFPAAGYMAMIGEAVRQMSGGIDEAFSLRRVVVGSATVLTEGKTIEFVTTLRKHRLTNALDSDWWEFTIASHNGAVWNRNCTGQAKAHTAEESPMSSGSIVEANMLAALPRAIEKKRTYEKLSQIGVNYGPRFQALDLVTSGTIEPRARAHITNGLEKDSGLFHLHPTLLDAALQLQYVAATKGWSLKHGLAVPTSFELLTITRTSEPVLHLDVSAVMGAGGHTVGNVKAMAGDRVVLNIASAHMSPIGGNEDDDKNAGPLTTARLEWAPHIDFVDTASLIKPSMDRAETTPQLDELHRLCLVYSQRFLSTMSSTEIAHMRKFQAWVDRQLQETSPSLLQDMHNAPLSLLVEKANELVHRLESTPAKDAAVAMQKVMLKIGGIYDGSVNPFEVLLADGTLHSVYSFINECDLSGLVSTLAHTKPNLRILEIGAGTGTATAGILKSLVLGGPEDPDRRVLYSRYTFTDLSAGFFVAAKERFKDYPNMSYATLDISKDPEAQGFDVSDAAYDLVLATNVLHATAPLAASLAHVRSLLAPDGRLLLHELHSTSKWVNYIFGTLAGWWYGEDEGRVDEPYLSPAEWETQLKAAGFHGLDAAVLDSAEPWHLNAVMVARPAPADSLTNNISKAAITLVLPAGTGVDDDHKAIQPIADELRRRYAVTEVRFGQHLPANQHAVALLDTQAPFFANVTAARLDEFKKLLDGAAGVLWVTPLCQQQKDQKHVVNPGYAQVIGAARTLRLEKAFHLGTCEVDDLTTAKSAARVVDVFERFRTHKGDVMLAPDYEYAVVDGTVQVGRYFPFSLKKELLAAASSSSSQVDGDGAKIALSIEKRASLDTLAWVPKDTKPLVGDEVLVHTYAAGLNFKDVLGALGIIDLPAEGLGHEASGIVTATGPEVTDLQIGDRVMLLGFGSFASHITTTERCCGRIPDALSFADAATMPTVYATAVYCLFEVGGLTKGQSVLIHSACGGVGIAALQLARMVGADIHVTVGNEEKVRYLMDTFQIPRSRIYNSRNESFVGEVMRETGGKGVDLALNSLSGELLHATWRCVAEFGKLVEIGKRDLMEGGKLDMDVFLANRNYLCVDLGRLQSKRGCRDVYKNLLSRVATYLEEGLILPIRPIRVFDASSAHEAYRYMQEGKHMGKVVLALRDEHGNSKIGASQPLQTPKALQLDPSASYLLVGGLGGIGKSLARYMAEHGARHLVFLARSAEQAAHEALIREFDSLGCKVSLVRGSVTDKGDVERAVAQAANLKGVLQLSMVLRDEAWDRMTAEQWHAAAGPKVTGTWNLHEATRNADTPLDFFVLSSSVSGIFGQPGQANYAAANTFLDAFVQYRASLGLTASCIDIGAMEDVGYVSQTEGLLQRMRHTGFWTIPEDELLEALVAAMTVPTAEMDPQKRTFVLGLASTLPLNHPDNQASWRHDRRMAAYHNAVSVAAEGDGSTNVVKQLITSAKADTAILKKPETAKLLTIEIGKKLANLLLKPEEDMQQQPSSPLSELGMDSLVAIQMRNWWKQTLEFDISVLEMLALGTLDALGKHAVDGLLKVSVIGA